MVATYHVLSIYIVVRTLRRNDVSMLQVTGTFSLRNQPWLLLFGFVIVMKLASYFSQSIGVQIASVFNSGIYERLYAAYVDGAVVVNIHLIMMRVLSFTLGPIFEDLLFRGYLLNKWSAKYGVGEAVVLSSMTCSLIHFNPSLYLTYFLVGLFYGLVYVKTKKLIVPIILHAVSNFISTVTIFTPKPNFSSAAELQHSINIEAIIYIILLPIVCFMLYRYYRGIKKVSPYDAYRQLEA